MKARGMKAMKARVVRDGRPRFGALVPRRARGASTGARRAREPEFVGRVGFIAIPLTDSLKLSASQRRTMPDIPKNLMSQNFFDELEETMEKMGTLVGQINPRFALSAVEDEYTEEAVRGIVVDSLRGATRSRTRS